MGGAGAVAGDRRDLVAAFGVSLAQASSDLQKYQELNPGALQYHMNRKRYEGAREMRWVLIEALRLEAGGRREP